MCSIENAVKINVTEKQNAEENGGLLEITTPVKHVIKKTIYVFSLYNENYITSLYFINNYYTMLCE